jgi:flagellar M-ring protein FliF
VEKLNWREWWDERSGSERLALAIGVPVFLICIVVGAMFAFRPSYEALFSGLSSQDVTSIANQLAAEGVAYKVDEENGRILVPRQQVHDTRIKVMEAGIPLHRPVGFELFDHVDFGMTEFTQRINYQRALEGELTRTILALKEVERARLHLVLPEERLFSSDSTQPKAALTLSIRPNMRLSAERVAGIQHLISSSVPGLSPGGVAIHDDKGASLVGSGGSSMGHVNARIDAKRAVESYLADKAQALLNRSFGAGNAIVQIDAVLEHDQRQITRDEVIPVRGGVTGAVTGMKSLRGPARTSDIDPESGEARLTSRAVTGDLTTEVKYEAGRLHETVSVATGAVKKLTVSVLVPMSTNEDLRRSVLTAVGNAIGVDLERGDTVSVIGIPDIVSKAKGDQVTSESFDSGAPSTVGSSQIVDGVDNLVWIILCAAGLGGALIFVLIQVGQPRRRLSAAQLDQFKRELQSWIDDPTPSERGTSS